MPVPGVANATPTMLGNGMKLQDRSLEAYRARINIVLGKPAAEEEPVAEPASTQQR